MAPFATTRTTSRMKCVSCRGYSREAPGAGHATEMESGIGHGQGTVSGIGHGQGTVSASAIGFVHGWWGHVIESGRCREGGKGRDPRKETVTGLREAYRERERERERHTPVGDHETGQGGPEAGAEGLRGGGVTGTHARTRARAHTHTHTHTHSVYLPGPRPFPRLFFLPFKPLFSSVYMRACIFRGLFCFFLIFLLFNFIFLGALSFLTSFLTSFLLLLGTCPPCVCVCVCVLCVCLCVCVYVKVLVKSAALHRRWRR